MSLFLLGILVGLPLAWLVAFGAYAYLDAPKHGMNPRKWGLIAFGVPLFGLFAYLFERSERDYDSDDDPYAGGDGGDSVFAIHESRQDEESLGPAGTEANDGDDDEWNDPDGVDL